MDFPEKFYSATKEYQTSKNTVHAPYIRRSFEIDGNVKSAALLISGLGFYELYLNGKNITKGHMSPYISNPDDIVYFDLYDIKPHLNVGRNTIGIILGNGFQNMWGGFVWDLHIGRFTSAPKFAFRADISFDDDTALSFEADESCKCYPSPIYEDDLHYGESCDATKEITDWALPSYDDKFWNCVIPSETPLGEFRICEVAPIVATRELKAVKIWKEGDAYVYDFGENCAGVSRLRINGEKGQKITIHHGELLKDGLFSQCNIIFKNFETRFPGFPKYTQRIIYTCKGDGEETYQPKFTYFGFQYARIEGITDEQATPELLTYVVMNSDLQERGSFECSDATLNKLQEMTRRSTLANFFHFPVDCPHREKNGWMADAALSAEQALLNLNPEIYYREWIRNVGKAMKPDGSLPGIVPTAGWGFEWGNGPAWDTALFTIPYYTYLYRGDKEIIKENTEYFLRYLNYLITKRDENGLVEFGLGDWCPTYVQQGYYSTYKSPLIFTDSVMAYEICKMAAYMLGEIGLNEEKEFAASLADSFRDSIRKNLIDLDKMIAVGDTQTSQAMAIYYGIFTPEESEIAINHLVRNVMENEVSMDLGVLGARVIFHVLSDYGYYDLAYDLCTNENGMTYAKMIKSGLNTLAEDFFFDSSLNHHFWGDISGWMIKDIAGIRINPNRRDAKEVNVKPNFISKLNFVKGRHISVAGEIISEWTRSGEGISLSVTAPKEAYGKIILPNGYVFENNNNSTELKIGRTEYSISKRT